MDFVEGLPLSEGKSIILTVVDRFTKFSHFFAISHPYTICKAAEFSLMRFSNYTGCLARLFLIGDVIFTSTFWQELFRLQETELNLSSACHPQSDGQVEAKLWKPTSNALLVISQSHGQNGWQLLNGVITPPPFFHLYNPI